MTHPRLVLSNNPRWTKAFQEVTRDQTTVLWTTINMDRQDV